MFAKIAGIKNTLVLTPFLVGLHCSVSASLSLDSGIYLLAEVGGCKDVLVLAPFLVGLHCSVSASLSLDSGIYLLAEVGGCKDVLVLAPFLVGLHCGLCTFAARLPFGFCLGKFLLLQRFKPNPILLSDSHLALVYIIALRKPQAREQTDHDESSQRANRDAHRTRR